MHGMGGPAAELELFKSISLVHKNTARFERGLNLRKEWTLQVEEHEDEIERGSRQLTLRHIPQFKPDVQFTLLGLLLCRSHGGFRDIHQHNVPSAFGEK